MAQSGVGLGDWGKGIFETQRAHLTAGILDDEVFGLRELRAKVNGRAGFKGDSVPNRFSIYAELCHGTTSIEIVRKYLDSGVLEKYYDDLTKNDRCWIAEDAYRFTLIAAGAMSLGCTISADVRQNLESNLDPKYLEALKRRPGNPDGMLAFSVFARAQMKEALAAYNDGTPYDFGNKHMYMAMTSMTFPSTKSTIENVGELKIIKSKLPNGEMIPQIAGVPTDEEMGLAPIHPYHVCANCGAEKSNHGKDDGEPSVCSRCHDRNYCSKACQKKHWKLHRVICRIPVEQMEEFLQSIASCRIAGNDDDLVRAMESL